LNCLALLLRNPGLEFHVLELVGRISEKSLPPREGEQDGSGGKGEFSSNVGPILDARAKAEYKCRLDELRKDLEEAERYQDCGRAECFRNEIDALAQQLAAAVGLGGQDRRVGSDAERARCAVTKRIKSSISRIEQGIPALGIHLAARVKTGYFCSYNPHPERPVAWNFDHQAFWNLKSHDVTSKVTP
jgi:non-specific serine/threonine protein kinase